jgi:hypothetical protein
MTIKHSFYRYICFPQIRLLVAGICLEFDFVEVEFRYYEVQRLHYFIPDFIGELNKIKVGGGERRF